MRIRLLSEADLGFADRVRQIAGWNQLPGDWRRFLALEPEGCFLAEVEGQPAGTATVTCYGTDLAWIGMVLVHPDFRRQGVGTALLEHAIQYLRENRGIRSVKLDATPEGQPLYEKLGFRAEWGLRRWRSGSRPDGQAVAPAPVALSGASLAFDREVFGADRSPLLRSLAAEGLGGELGADGDFALMRDGARALYLGPAVARNEASGAAMMEALIRRAPADRWIFWDIPDGSAAAVSLAGRLGFEPVRVLTRMWLGGNDTPGDPSRVWALADPAFG